VGFGEGAGDDAPLFDVLVLVEVFDDAVLLLSEWSVIRHLIISGYLFVI
jgi:hypothetical protein